MRKLLLISLIAFGAPAWSQADLAYKQCENLSYEVTMLILGGAPIELVFDYVKYYEHQWLDGANDDDRLAKYLARTVYEIIGKRKNAGMTMKDIDIRVSDEFCNGVTLEKYKSYN